MTLQICSAARPPQGSLPSQLTGALASTAFKAGLSGPDGLTPHFSAAVCWTLRAIGVDVPLGGPRV